MWINSNWSWKKNRIWIFNNQIIHSIIFDRSFEIESYENKERVPFYMSIPTTMKFIVRGKSVEFFNREGSSPSIPNKKPILLPRSLFLLILFIHFYSFFFHQWLSLNKMKYLSHFIHSVLLQMDPNINPRIFFKSNLICFV